MSRLIGRLQELEQIEGRAWLYDIITDPGRKQRIEVRLTGTANATQDDTLPDRVAKAKQTCGRSVVEQIISRWEALPPMIEIGSEWITFHHRNGYFSRIGHQVPAGLHPLEALVERSKIRISHRQGVEEMFEFSDGRWTFKALYNGALRHDGPLLLSDVIARVSDGQAQDARDIDPEGTAMLPRRQLEESEARVLRSLIEEWPYDTIEQIRVELTRGRSLSYAGVEAVLDALRVQGHVEEFEPGHWRASDQARHIRHRLLAPLTTAA